MTTTTTDVETLSCPKRRIVLISGLAPHGMNGCSGTFAILPCPTPPVNPENRYFGQTRQYCHRDRGKWHDLKER